jgi:hypothetical protein
MIRDGASTPAGQASEVYFLPFAQLERGEAIGLGTQNYHLTEACE